MDHPVRICSWCWSATVPTLTVLDHTPVELALLAIEEGQASHGICPDHLKASRKLLDEIRPRDYVAEISAGLASGRIRPVIAPENEAEARRLLEQIADLGDPA